MTTAITIGMIIIYVAIMMGIGVYTARQTRSVSDFVLGSHSVGSWLTAFAYGTSYFSAVVFIGYAGQFGWTYGVSAAWVGIGNALLGSLLAWIVLGRRTRIMTQSLGAKTMPEYFEKRWNSKGLKIAAALIVFVFLIPYTASVYNGLSRLFNMAFQIESEGAYKIIIIVMALLTAIYVILGGYAATAINDFIQGIVMLIGIAAVVICAIQNQGGLTSALAALGEIEVNGKTNTLNSVFGPDPLNLLGVVILTSLGTWGLPQMIHKFYAIKSENDIKKGAVISTVFALIVAGGSYLLGGFDRLFCTLTEDGSGLSQGQKQLLCIARIMLTDPPFLILDEATSSIDLRTEQRIQKAFEKLMAGKTSFIIAHRLSTIKSADWILVMNQGNVLEQGTHDSLMAQKGFYANLYQSQFADSETTGNTV